MTRSLKHWFLGPPGVSRLTITHCVHSAAETFFTVSLAGSIFFSVSPDAARPRVLLFLVLSLGPFLVMAPLIGPFVDRVRGGLATTMISTFAVRAVLALLVAQQLRTVLLFPLAFAVLVVAKTYTVSRNALVPSLVDDEQDLVSANARLSRSATMVGAVAAASAVLTFRVTSPEGTLIVAAALYSLGVAAAWQVRRVARPIEPIDAVSVVELVRPDVSGAVVDMLALRAAIGFAVFQFAFSLRSDGEPAWVVGAVLVANGAGGFTGTVVSPVLRRRVSERAMFTAALIAPTIATVICGLAFGRSTLIAAVFVLGLSVSVGRRALDATIQRQAPHARRGQVYASLETRLELVWVLAACLAVAVRVASWIGMIMLAGFLATFAVVHLRRYRGLNIMRPLSSVSLADRLLVRAEALAEHGFYDEAVIVAGTAEAAASRSGATRPGDPSEARAAIARARIVVAETVGLPGDDDDAGVSAQTRAGRRPMFRRRSRP